MRVLVIEDVLELVIEDVFEVVTLGDKHLVIFGVRYLIINLMCPKKRWDMMTQMLSIYFVTELAIQVCYKRYLCFHIGKLYIQNLNKLTRRLNFKPISFRFTTLRFTSHGREHRYLQHKKNSLEHWKNSTEAFIMNTKSSHFWLT